MAKRTESEIMEGWPEGYDGPLVTVLAISYCHEKYLRTALDSILSQETSFPFELIVHDDASTDNSASIIREYVGNYPHIIRPILEDENQYSKGVQAVMRAVKPYVRGRYIAYLDCDDYWTDSHKLQVQVEYLESHPAFLAVAHNCTVVNEDGIPTGEQYPECRDEEFTTEHFFNEILAGQLGTLMIRDFLTQSTDDHPLIVNSLPGPFDRVLNLTLLMNGRVHCIQKSMSAYRHIVDNGTSFSATYQYDIKRDARFYLSFVNYCKKMGRIGDAIGMLRWFIGFTENYQYVSPESRQEAEPILAFCRSSISSLTDQLTDHSLLPSANFAVYVMQEEDSCYTEEKCTSKSVIMDSRYNCAVSLSEFGEISGLRIDPMDQPCFLKNISVCLITSDGEQLSAPIRQTNAISFRDALLFDTEDPQIELCVPQGRYQAVSFSSKLLSFNSEEIEYFRNTADNESKLKQSETDRLALAKQLEETIKQLSSVTEQLEALRNDYDVISGSSFWKITKPARVCLDTMKKALRMCREALSNR